MKLFRTLALVAASLCVAVAAHAAPAPLELYGSLPTIDDAAVAPDGSAFAVVLVQKGVRTLLVRKLTDGSTAQFGLGEVKLRSVDWVGPEDIVLTASTTGSLAGIQGARRRENYHAFHLNVPGKKLQRLLASTPARSQTGTNIRASGKNSEIYASMNTIYGPPEVRMVDGKPTLFLTGVAFKGEYGVLTVFKQNLKSGQSDIVEIGTRDTRDILLGADGQPVAQTTYDSDSGRWGLKLKKGVGYKEVQSLQAPNESPFIAGLGRDGQSVLLGQSGEKGLVLREVTSEGAFGDPLPVDDVRGTLFDPESHKLIGTYALVGDEDRYAFFDPKDQRAWNSVKAAFKGSRVSLVSWSNDRRVIIVLVDSPTEGPAYAFVDMNQKKASFIGPQYNGLLPDHISPVTPIAFKARDGMNLSGYLTTPKAGGKNLPLVVFPHGGPASRDTLAFDWWAQGMASRGYAVLQVNFRGSSGFGWEHLEAGFGQWGRKMQTDLSDGVAHLAKEGVIDPKRVCIVGASYGGYAALAGAAFDSDVYRCSVSVSGLSDLRRFVEWSADRSGADARRYWNRFMGAENARDPVLAAYSPAIHAEKVKAPVLLIHGRDDTVVPLEQSRFMQEALSKAGKSVELVVQAGEDHWLSQSDTRLQTLEATVAFLEKHNPPN